MLCSKPEARFIYKAYSIMKQVSRLAQYLAILGIAFMIGCAPMPGPPGPPPEAVDFCRRNGGHSEARLTALRQLEYYCFFPDGSACSVAAFHQGGCRPGAQPTPVPASMPSLTYATRYTDTTLGAALSHPEFWPIDFGEQMIAVGEVSSAEFRVEVMPDQAGVVDPEALVETIRQGETGPHIARVDPITIDEQPAFLIQVNAFSRPQSVPLFLAVVVTPCARELDSYQSQTQVLYRFVEQPLIISATGMDLPLFEQFLQQMKLRELSPAC